MTPLDRLIDDVARGMTAERASARLRERTIAAIAEERRSWPWWKFAVPTGVVAAMAALAAIALVPRGIVLPDVQPIAAVTQTAVARPMASTSPVDVAAPVRRRVPAAAMTATEAAWHDRRLRTLEAPAPILPEVIQPERLAVPLLHVKPLATEALTIEPISGGR